MPFDRLVRCIDRWAQLRGRRDVFSQIGAGSERPKHIQWAEFLEPSEFRARVVSASVVVAHAGMGSIITALELGKPILVMPRRGDLMETRNDHQVATARRFLEQGRIAVAFDEHELVAKLESLETLRPSQRISAHASPQLLATLREFIMSGAAGAAGVTGAAGAGGVGNGRRQ
jgi:UDP-N-acetylglucosamine transferase subunit ALG13